MEKLDFKIQNKKNELKRLLSIKRRLLEDKRKKEGKIIKYTLRFSNKLNHYLNWKSKQVNMPKADWLRAEIHRLMAEDKSYQDKQK